MKKLKVQKFDRSQVNLDWKFTCSIEQVLKLGLLGYLDNISELRLRQYLILRGVKFLGGLVDYSTEGCRLRYKGQAKEVELQAPSGVIDLDLCFWKSDIETLKLCGEQIDSLYGLTRGCKLLRKVLIDIDFSDEVNDLRYCFSETDCLQQVTFSKVANRAKIDAMFKFSDIKEIRLSDYVINVEDSAWGCFYSCEKLVDLDCSEVKFNNGVVSIVGENPKLETISFRDCWFEDRVELVSGRFLRPVTIDLRGARCKGIEKVKSLSAERKSNKVVDEFITQFELEKVTLIVD